MSNVFLVLEEESGRLMALKRLKNEVNRDPVNHRRFMREAYVAGQLDHANIVRYHTLGLCGRKYFMLMELCEGGSVAQLLRERGGILDLELATRIFLQVLDGLDYAHNVPILRKLDNGNIVKSQGIVHRDVKPGNILLLGRDKNLTAKVADFGLAKAFATTSRELCTPLFERGGTSEFMPLRDYLNFMHATPAADVWAASATYYYMLTGCFVRPECPGEYTFMMKERVPVRQRNSAIPKKLAEVIDHALLETPTIGVSSARELKRMILEAL